MNEISQPGEIMIVEDDVHIARLLIFLFQREGFTIVHAADGLAAERMIEHNLPPALICMDVMLPYHDGIYLLKKLRTQPKWEDIPVMLLTAKTQENYIINALKLGANDYMVKPFQPGELVARVRRLLVEKP